MPSVIASLPRRSGLLCAVLLTTSWAAAAHARIVPDSTVLARVGTRTVTAGVFADNWVAGNSLTRPARSDSAGRHDFLNTLVSRELLLLGALERPQPLDFAQRTRLAGMRDDMMRNALYVKMVRDSAVVTEDDIKAQYEIRSHLLRLRRITCRTKEDCDGIRTRLVRGEPWSEMVKLSIDTSTVRKNGDTGMLGALHLGPDLSHALFPLPEGSLSPVLYNNGFWHLFYVQQRFKIGNKPAEDQYRSLYEEARRYKEAQIMARHEESFALARQVKYNGDNIVFAVRELSAKSQVKFTATGPDIDLSAVPEFLPKDTVRVLATSIDGNYTLGNFLSRYLELSPLVRPIVQNPEDLVHAINSFLFQPYLLKLATESGMENSAYFKEEMERQTERIRIEAYYSDSVEKKVRVTPQERQRYYDQHKNYYFTYTREHLFAFYRPPEQANGLADSLRRGLIRPADAVRRDSLAHPGMRYSEERVTWSNDSNDLRGIFKEMKDGEVRVVPTGELSTIIMRVEQIPGHQLRPDEVDSSIDELLRSQKAEAVLQKLLARLKKRYPVKLYTADLMDIDLTLL